MIWFEEQTRTTHFLILWVFLISTQLLLNNYRVSETHVEMLNWTSRTDLNKKSICCIFGDTLYLTQPPSPGPLPQIHYSLRCLPLSHDLLPLIHDLFRNMAFKIDQHLPLSAFSRTFCFSLSQNSLMLSLAYSRLFFRPIFRRLNLSTFCKQHA